MARHASKIITLAAIAGLVAGLTGCCNLIWTSKCPPKIAEQPKSKIAKVGDREVSFSVVVSKPREVSYQWQFNGTNICDATAATYTIPHRVGFSDVGEYEVLVRGNGITKGKGITLSKTAYLSIYAFSGITAGNAGTLSTPIGRFSQTGFKCDGKVFNKGYCPLDASDQPMFFYGPRATSQSGIFINPGFSNLVIDTFAADNGIADTGIRIRNNWYPPSPDACCNDNTPGGTDAKQSRCPISLSTNSGGVSQKNSYQLTVLYTDPPGAPATGKVTFNWSYQ